MNERMQKSWDVALDVLKPTKAQLEHGMALHQASVVCDAFGFAPCGAIDAEKVRAAFDDGASTRELSDLMGDMREMGCLMSPADRAEYLGAWARSGVTCVFQQAGAIEDDVGHALRSLSNFVHVADMMDGLVARAAKPEDIVAAKESGRHCMYFSSNAVHVPQKWMTVEGELEYIRRLFRLGIRMMHLTYNRRNLLGDGCAESANGGISDFGRRVIAEMNHVGVIVDVAHSGWRTSLEAARASTLPVVASHSACCGVNSHCRGKPDDVIRAIVDSGGYIGIAAVPAFLGGSGDIAAMLEHIDYAVGKFGVDHVVIGTDKAYTSPRLEAECAKLPPMRRQHPPFYSFWPSDDALFDSKWQQERQQLSMEWTNWPLFTVGLVQRGYADADIQKIVGGNALRVARQVFSARNLF